MGTVPSWCCLGSERGVTVMAAVVVIAELGWAVQLVAWVSIPGAVREGGDAPAVGRNGSSQMWVLTGRSVFLGTGQQQEKRFISGIIGINDVELAGQKKKMRKGGCALPGAGFWEGGAELEHGGGDAVAASGRWAALGDSSVHGTDPLCPSVPAGQDEAAGCCAAGGRPAGHCCRGGPAPLAGRAVTDLLFPDAQQHRQRVLQVSDSPLSPFQTGKDALGIQSGAALACHLPRQLIPVPPSARAINIGCVLPFARNLGQSGACRALRLLFYAS